MRRSVCVALCATSGLLLVAAISLPTSEAGGPIRNPWRSRNSVEDLAEKLDKLERALQYHGRVTAKAPDVWGQARLTQHRREFEEQMAAQLDAFEPNLNAEISVSDQAFLSQAVALSAASQGQQVPDLTTVTSATSTFTPTPATGPPPDPATNPGTTTTNVITRSLPFAAVARSGQANLPLSLEPEILLDQRKRFLDHLHEIRRVNEGDDTADAPGYSLNLVRIPISVIPGDKTRENYGAEVTVTAESHVTEELLPSTFRELVINDLIDQLALPIVKVLDLTWQAHLEGEPLRTQVDLLWYEIDTCEALRKRFREASPETRDDLLNSFGISFAKIQHDSAAANAQDWTKQTKKIWKERLGGALLEATRGNNPNPQLYFDRALELMITTMQSERQAAINKSNSILAQMMSGAKSAFGVQSPRERRSRYPIPPSQIRIAFGEREIAELTLAVFSARDRFQCRDKVHLADVQGFLRNELEHAYDFLGSTDCFELLPPPGPDGAIVGSGLWHSPHAPTPNDIRQPNAVIAKRKKFFLSLPVNDAGVATLPSYDHVPARRRNHAETATEALAWAVLVESALLNQQLNDDLLRVSQDPNCHCVPAGQPYCFYGPCPDAAAKQAFAEYVKCRWPIRIFALDPVTQQQNVADSFSLRREMQLAIALAFKQRLVNAQSLTRYMRRIEQDIRTIALNQTVVGFGAGDDTFGWRFFPRVQTPDVEGTLTVLGRDLIAGGPNRDQGLRRRRIEPGMRECVALVVMPSFVKHVRFDVRTNWFPLVPGHVTKLFHTARTPASMEKTVEWSKLIKSMEDSVTTCVKDEHLYRDGEVERLLKRSHQLSQELPINTMYAQVPYENTLGGFEMFASGVTDLAPELVGFYGAPGVDPNQPTELFLVGNNFSVHDTHLLAGNTRVKIMLLSREVMQVTIPPGVRIEPRLCKPRATTYPCNEDGCNDPYVELRLATPYGVSTALHVPVVAGSSVVLPDIQWERPSTKVTYRWTLAADKSIQVANADMLAAAPHQFVLDFPANYWNANSKASVTLQVLSMTPSDEVLVDSIPLLPASIVGGKRIITANEFSEIHQKIRTAVVADVNKPVGTTEPPPNFDVRVKATVTVDADDKKKFDVANEMVVHIRFARK